MYVFIYVYTCIHIYTYVYILCFRVDERIVLMVALLICCIAFIILIPFGKEHPAIKYPGNRYNASVYFIISLHLESITYLNRNYAGLS